MTTSPSVFYLFASPTGKPDQSSATVFYKVKGESLAKSLCNLFTKEYSDASRRMAFHHKAGTSLSAEDQVLLDESLDWLAGYDDPDPGIYDPQPSEETLLLAQYAVRAQRWERLLRQRTDASNGNGTLGSRDPAHGKPPPTDDLPEMSAEDRRNSGLIVLMLLAQAYYTMLESAISMASWVAARDLELNECYFWAVKNITNLLKNHGDLKDFPIPFEPLFPDLYPTTIRDVDWEDMVAPAAEQFLSTVQQYVHSKGTYDPEEGSPAWVFIELFRPGVKTAVERASAYNKRMRQHWQRLLGSSAQAPTESTPLEPAENHTMTSPSKYDAFISYRHQDPDKVFARNILTKLEWAGFKVAIDERDFDPSETFPNEMERCVKESRFTLAVVSPRYFDSGNAQEEAVICKVLGMRERKRRLVPLILEKVQMPIWMFDLVGIDFTAPDPLVDPLDKLKQKPGDP